ISRIAVPLLSSISSFVTTLTCGKPKISATIAGTWALSAPTDCLPNSSKSYSGYLSFIKRDIIFAILNPSYASGEIDYINAHGTSTPWNDKTETLAIKRVFGKDAAGIAISSTKSMTGHMLGAAGGMETAVTAMSLKHQVIPPTINYENPDPECDLDYVPNKARTTEVNYALTNSFGFGGTNGTLVLKRFEE
ncbi:unnamed protein product, partial [marine sediment metagenome]